MVVALIGHGFSLEYLQDIDLVSFNRLAEVMLKVKYSEKQEDAWTHMIAAQGEFKVMKKHLARWKPLLNGLNSKADNSDQEEFLKKFGGGI